LLQQPDIPQTVILSGAKDPVNKVNALRFARFFPSQTRSE